MRKKGFWRGVYDDYMARPVVRSYESVYEPPDVEYGKAPWYMAYIDSAYSSKREQGSNLPLILGVVAAGGLLAWYLLRNRSEGASEMAGTGISGGGGGGSSLSQNAGSGSGQLDLSGLFSQQPFYTPPTVTEQVSVPSSNSGVTGAILSAGGLTGEDLFAGSLAALGKGYDTVLLDDGRIQVSKVVDSRNDGGVYYTGGVTGAISQSSGQVAPKPVQAGPKLPTVDLPGMIASGWDSLVGSVGGAVSGVVSAVTGGSKSSSSSEAKGKTPSSSSSGSSWSGGGGGKTSGVKASGSLSGGGSFVDV